MKVFVYYNLTKSIWSIKALEGPHKGLVVAYSKEVGLVGVTPKVSQKGRERVLRERKKYVHAGLVGNLKTLSDNANILKNIEGDFSKRKLPSTRHDSRLTYNPFKSGSFLDKDLTGLVFIKSKEVFMDSDRAVYSWGSSFEKAFKHDQLTFGL